jgi:hypothetical protein
LADDVQNPTGKRVGGSANTSPPTCKDLLQVQHQSTVPAPAAPGYWKHERSGVLEPAVRAYLADDDLSSAHMAALRSYLRQWMAADWRGNEVPDLRARIDGLTSRAAFRAWFDDAFEIGIDPL